MLCPPAANMAQPFDKGARPNCGIGAKNIRPIEIAIGAFQVADVSLACKYFQLPGDLLAFHHAPRVIARAVDVSHTHRIKFAIGIF